MNGIPGGDEAVEHTVLADVLKRLKAIEDALTKTTLRNNMLIALAVGIGGVAGWVSHNQKELFERVIVLERNDILPRAEKEIDELRIRVRQLELGRPIAK